MGQASVGSGARSRTRRSALVRVMVPVAAADVVVRRVSVRLGTVIASGRMCIRVTADHVAVHVRVLTDEVDPEQQVAVAQQRVERAGGGEPVVRSEDDDAVGETL